MPRELLAFDQQSDRGAKVVALINQFVPTMFRELALAEAQRSYDWQRGIETFADWSSHSPDGLTHAELAAKSKGLSSPWGIADLFLGRRPLAVNDQGRLFISGTKEINYSLDALLQLNMVRSLVLWAIHSFAPNQDRRGIPEDKVASLYQKIKPIFVDLDILAKDNMTFAANRFREANLFTPHGNGDDYISWLEGIDEVQFILSGISIDQQLEDDLVGKCMKAEERSKRDTLVKFSCIRSAYANSLPKMATHLPGFGAWMETNRSLWESYFENTLKSAGYIPNAKEMVKREDLALFPHVVQYIEMIYALHDSDSNGFINATEAVKAFPIYKNIFKKLAAKELAAGDITEDDLPGLFCYVLKKGHPPDDTFEKGYFKYWWLSHPNSWDTWAGRGKFSQILGYVADQLRDAKN
jgi:hypothetical protein